MGNAALRSLAALKPARDEDFMGRVVAIDAHNWLYKYLTTTVRFTEKGAYTTEEGVEVANLIGVVRGVSKLLQLKIQPVMVFDGIPTELKNEVIEERRRGREMREIKLEEAIKSEDKVEIYRLTSQTQKLTATIHKTTRELFELLDVPYVEAPAEGEGQCSYMARHDERIDCAGSDDYDTLLFGAPITLRKLTGSGDVEIMKLQETLSRNEITWEQLVDIGILSGTDFNEGLMGVGPKTALKEVIKYGDIWEVLDARSESIEHVDRIREMFLQPTVTDKYEFETIMKPDIEASRNYIVKDWGIPKEKVDRGLIRIEELTKQTGLGRWF
tara:strand:+ start:15075 stop:16058 length:984 start_codon:yes stop_codon:yes gene_type:complete